MSGRASSRWLATVGRLLVSAPTIGRSDVHRRHVGLVLDDAQHAEFARPTALSRDCPSAHAGAGEGGGRGRAAGALLRRTRDRRAHQLSAPAITTRTVIGNRMIGPPVPGPRWNGLLMSPKRTTGKARNKLLIACTRTGASRPPVCQATTLREAPKTK